MIFGENHVNFWRKHGNFRRMNISSRTKKTPTQRAGVLLWIGVMC